MNRKETLHSAEVCVCGQREEDYGSPEDNFRVIARYWEVYLRNRCVGVGAIVDILPDDVANLMALLKIGRITTGMNAKEDNYVDACGYMACAAEIATAANDINAVAAALLTAQDKLHQSAIEDERVELAYRALTKKQGYCAKHGNKEFCRRCQIGRESGLDSISCERWVEFHPAEALEIMRKAVE